MSSCLFLWLRMTASPLSWIGGYGGGCGGVSGAVAFGNARHFFRNVLFTESTYLFSWARALPFFILISLYCLEVAMVLVQSPVASHTHILNLLSRFSIHFSENRITSQSNTNSYHFQTMPYCNRSDEFRSMAMYSSLVDTLTLSLTQHKC